MSDPGPRTIRIVFDTTAVTAFVRGSVAVGEMLIMMDDEHGAVVVPLQCLVEAAHRVPVSEHPKLDLLVENEQVFLLVDDATDWRSLAAMRGLVERPDLASAALFALTCDVDVMTRDARWYSAVHGGRIVHEFED